MNFVVLSVTKRYLDGIAVPAGGAGAIGPQVFKIWANVKFFGQRYEKFGQSQKF